jgi:hypothetical protein
MISQTHNQRVAVLFEKKRKLMGDDSKKAQGQIERNGQKMLSLISSAFSRAKISKAEEEGLETRSGVRAINHSWALKGSHQTVSLFHSCIP